MITDFHPTPPTPLQAEFQAALDAQRAAYFLQPVPTLD